MSKRRYNTEIIKQIVGGENPFVQIGYTPKIKKHKKGDEWTDVRGVVWKQMSGAKIRVNKHNWCKGMRLGVMKY